MAKHEVKAESLVNSAVSTFVTAAAKVEQANDILTKAIVEDVTKLENIEKQIAGLYRQMDIIQMGVTDKRLTITENDKLIEKLNGFIK